MYRDYFVALFFVHLLILLIKFDIENSEFLFSFCSVVDAHTKFPYAHELLFLLVRQLLHYLLNPFI